MDVWYAYREVWAAHPWVLIIGLLGVLAVLAGIVGSVASGVLAILFVPGLALLYIHHLIAKKHAE